ncbi:nicotinate-nucleotide diphosphorylase (carboxylating), partial [Candidatus Peregrinibacteria bacterium RIFOXYA2_FULL_33_7]
ITWIINEYSSIFHTKISLQTFIKDGEKVEKQNKILLLEGPINHLLILERTILNILQRMSGISTKTTEIIAKVNKINPEILITTTRKTPYGLLDKKAAQVGGAGTHRLNLSDAVLIKDTHLDFFDRNISEVLNKILKSTNFGKFVEIEVQNEEEARVAAQTFNENKYTGTVLLDNFSSEKINNCVNQLKKQNLFEKIILEASGGITEDNIEEYAKNEIDIISLGSLTHSAQALDLAMTIEKK